MLLGVDKTSKGYNSFVLVPKMNGKVRSCLDPARPNKAHSRPAHRGLPMNDILQRLTVINYLTLINASSGYHYPKLDGKSSYLTMFSCPFGRYRYIRLPFGFADDILIVGFDEHDKDHEK